MMVVFEFSLHDHPLDQEALHQQQLQVEREMCLWAISKVFW
jgi:hypothetical protein